MQDLEDYLVGCLRLVITLGVIDGRPMLRNPELFTKLLEIFIFKLSSIISNDGGRYTIPAYDVIHYKQSYSLAISY